MILLFIWSIKSKIIFVTVDNTENCSFKLVSFSSSSPAILKPTETYVLYFGPDLKLGSPEKFTYVWRSTSTWNLTA